MRLRLLSVKIVGIFLLLLLWGGGDGLALASGSPSSKGQALSVRAADHGAFTRIVLESAGAGKTPDIEIRDTVETKGDDVTVILGSSIPVDLSRIGSGVPRIGKVDSEDLGVKGVRLRIQAPGHERVRHFRVGNRVMIDVYGAIGSSEASQKPSLSSAASVTQDPSEASVTASSGERSPEKPAPEQKEKTGQEIPPADLVKTSPSGSAMPAAQVSEVGKESLAQPLSEKHVIALTSTEAAGMAAFVRSGTLWIVFDRTNLPVDARIEGPRKNMFPPLERVDFEGGTAFHAELPGPANVYTEGGGLVWRVVLTPGVRQTYPVLPRRTLSSGDSAKGSGGEETSSPSSEESSALLWPTKRAGKALSLNDSSVGDVLRVVTVDRAPESAGSAHNYVDFTQLRSAAGFVFAPKVDDLDVRIVPEGVLVTRPSGLSLASPEDLKEGSSSPGGKESVGALERPSDGATEEESSRIYHFNEWTMGGDKAIEDNRRIIMSGIADKDDMGRTQDLLTLARMHVANGWGPEALGFLRIVLQLTPELETNPSFLALRGAARVLAGKNELALRDLSATALEADPDVRLWRAATVAGLEDWRQAAQILPSEKEMMPLLEKYPVPLRNPLALTVAEIVLREGKPDEGAALLELLGSDDEALRPGQKEERRYLEGEILRQKGEKEQASDVFKALADGRNDLFRARGGLALVNLGVETGTMKPSEAIDRLEGLRFGWRGDELEMLIGARLGKIYLMDGQYAKGLSVLKDAAALSPDTPMAADIRSDMRLAFSDVFLTDRLDKLSPLDAITLYDAFQDLTPEGSEGDRMIRRLAESLVKADLLGRAAALIQSLIDHRLSGPEAAQAAVRLAAIDLLDGRPEDAQKAVQKAESLRDVVTDPQVRARLDHNLILLRARALSQTDKPEQALALLGDIPPDPDVNRLRVDIAWNSGNWDEAGEALADLILDSGVLPQGPIDENQSALIINRVVALALADNRLALANMRDLYAKAMAKTPQGRLFDVITRERKAAVLADRETLKGVVSEVDLFRSFLDSMKNEAISGSTAKKTENNSGK